MSYEETIEDIQKRMLANVPNDVDKREGSIIYDALKPASIEIGFLYDALNFFIKNTFGDTASREYLIERAKERGLSPKEATPAIAKIKAVPSEVNIAIGTSFSYDDLNYTVTEVLPDGEYLSVCNEKGTIGNKPMGKLIPNSYIPNLQMVNLLEITIPGEDEEGTEAFRARYLASFDSKAYGGNIADYKEKVNAIPGIGGCKIYPVWNGGGSVKIVFMTAEAKPPTEEFINNVQTLIDPIPNQGEGVGIAPIGHTVTVEGAKEDNISITLSISTEGDIEALKPSILEIIDGYFSELNKGWADTKKDSLENMSNTGIAVRISQIESRILALPGVTDISHTKLNGLEENYILPLDSLAQRGEIIWE